MKLLSLLIPLFLFFSFSAYADREKDYMTLSCDKENKVATIKFIPVWNDAKPPEDSIYLYSLTKPKQVCDLGEKLTIAISAGESLEHPRNNNASVYLNGRRIKRIITAWPDSIILTPSDKDYYVNMKECFVKTQCGGKKGNYFNPDVDCKNAKLENGLLCLTHQVTGASFNCSKIHSDLENHICSNDLLAKADVEMNALYKQAKKLPNSKEIVQSQRKWLKNLDQKCKTSSYDSTVVPCLLDAYNLRIQELQNTLKITNSGAIQ